LLDRFVAEAAAEHGLPRPTFSRDARRRLKSHDWPGNLTELRNLAERLTILVGGREVSPTNLPAELRGTHAPGTSQGFVLPGEGVILDEVEAGLIRQALERTGGNRSRAARLLGLSRDTFLYRMKKYAIH
jgi:DNA-binding NtrC family response regulator